MENQPLELENKLIALRSEIQKGKGLSEEEVETHSSVGKGRLTGGHW